MHAIRSVTCLHKGSRRMSRYANDCVRSAERPEDPATHPVAMVDVHVDEGLGSREGRKDYASNGIPRPVRRMQDLNAVAPDVGGDVGTAWNDG